MAPLSPSISGEQLAIAAIQLRARQSAFWLVKRRARDYRARPAQLEILYPGLSCVGVHKMIAVGEVLLNAERSPRAKVELVPVKAANAKAVIILGRFYRRFGARLAEVA